MTPIHYAALVNDEVMVISLLEAGADPHMKDFSGEEAYQNCSKDLQAKIDEFLIK
jgi:ankyrin repeat protein